jgi:UTP--glucose-1-phosphate uridylyltransferase
MIKQAIIPLAGLGTRLLPLTSVFAKELLPINGKPGIEYILDECIEAGIKEVIFIVFQEKPLGTGDAVLKTKKLIKDKYFLMLLPDDLIIKQNCSKSMIAVHKKYKASVMASMKVNKNEVTRWGIYNIKKKINNKNFTIKSVVEKPSIKDAPSNNAVIGRYILPNTIFNKLSKLEPGKGGEIHITDAIQSLINDNDKFIGHNFSGKYLDCGSMNGYINSTLEIAKK